MTTPEDKLQIKFVDWLIKHDLYNTYDTAHTMRRMMSIWKAAGLHREAESQYG